MKKRIALALTVAGLLGVTPLYAAEGQATTVCTSRNFKEVKTVTPFSLTHRPKSKRLLYDDIACGLKWRKKQCSSIQMSFDTSALVYDYATQAEIVVNKATFVQSADIKSPLGSGIAAFVDPAAADAFLAAQPAGGKKLTYQELLQLELP